MNDWGIRHARIFPHGRPWQSGYKPKTRPPLPSASTRGFQRPVSRGRCNGPFPVFSPEDGCARLRSTTSTCSATPPTLPRCRPWASSSARPGLPRAPGHRARQPAPDLGQTYARCRQLASALQRAGIGKNDTVAVMLPNTPPMVEAHFGVPMAGAVLNALNTRLDPKPSPSCWTTAKPRP